MKKYAFMFLLISKIVATQERDFMEDRSSYYICSKNVIETERFFIKNQYSENDKKEHNIKMEDSAKIIIDYLIKSKKETPESLMKKLNEVHVMLLGTGPIVEFAQGSILFPAIAYNLKDYYDRHKNISLVNPPKPSVPTEHSWFQGIQAFFSSATSESSQGTSISKISEGSYSSDSDTDPLVKKKQ